jgi:hypothetical protein
VLRSAPCWLALFLSSLAACGAADWEASELPSSDPARSAAPSASVPAPTASTSEPEPTSPPQPASKEARLAKKLQDGWIAWAPKASGFVAVTSYAEEGSGAGVIANFFPIGGEKAQFTTLCEPEDDCLAEDGDAGPRIQSWLEERELGAALAIEPTPFVEQSNVLSAKLVSIGGTLTWRGDHLDLVRGGKVTSLAKVVVDKEFKARPYATVTSTDSQHLFVLYEFDPGENYAKGFNVYVDGAVYPVPTTPAKPGATPAKPGPAKPGATPVKPGATPTAPPAKPGQ